ncbi:unnamed protein product [Gemmata massiliana]|uniref:Uncharacterized protein n=1 Tax=Gemmata massiliana TaxID=1210884 RepID=A0A6P2D197_9BACT|nr:hypothetical protein [Gemmata massiliana]VTR95108.1 unnamed protein product [Gemmata massiliana]
MGIDVKAMFEHNLDQAGIENVSSMLTPERFPLLHALAWRHPLWQGETPAEERSWRWEMPKGCTTFEEAWAFERDTSNPLVHDVHLKSGRVILTFEDRIADLYSPVRWHIFVGSPNIQRAYQGACRELAVAFGGKKCMYLADSLDSHEIGTTLDDFEALLGYPPVGSFEALSDVEPDKENVNLARYYIDRFDDANP